MNRPKILIADDDRTMRKGIRFELEDLNYRVFEAATKKEAFELLNKNNFDLVISDLKMPEISDGMSILEESKRINPHSIVLVITGFGSIEIAVEAMKAGADDFVTKDASVQEILLKVERLLQLYFERTELLRIREENERLRKELSRQYQFENLIGNSKAFQNMLTLVGKVADDGECTVLLQGESGTGKELIARAIHYNSPRKNKPYVVVNVAALPETLLESELFGHVRGAFTDAVKDRDGKFKLAEGGTLFLDEIGELSLKLQIKLLRVLQEKTFEPVGSNKVLAANVRIVAATNQDLLQKVQDKSFREDLFYRLYVVPIKLPPLRERKQDIPLLADYFLTKFCQQRNRKLKLNAEIINLFLHYDWPGNVRELENVIEQLVVLSTDEMIQKSDLPPSLHQSSSISTTDSENLVKARANLVANFEKQFIAEALKKNDWNISRTAKTIGISREGLHRMIRKYDLTKYS